MINRYVIQAIKACSTISTLVNKNSNLN